MILCYMAKKYIRRFFVAFLSFVLLFSVTACNRLNNVGNNRAPIQMLTNLRYFTSNDDLIYFISGNSLYEWQLGSEKVHLLFESINGRYLQYIDNKIYYTNFEKGQLCAFDLQTGEEAAIVQIWDPAVQALHPGYYGQWWFEDPYIYCLAPKSQTKDPRLELGMEIRIYDLNGDFMHIMTLPTELCSISLIYDNRMYYHQNFQNGTTYVYDFDTGSSSELLSGTESCFYDAFQDEMIVCTENKQYYLYGENDQLRTFPYEISDGYGHYVAMNDDVCYTWEDSLGKKTLVKQNTNQRQEIIYVRDDAIDRSFFYNSVLFLQVNSNFLSCTNVNKIINVSNASENQIEQITSWETLGRNKQVVSLAIYPDGTVYILNIDLRN